MGSVRDACPRSPSHSVPGALSQENRGPPSQREENIEVSYELNYFENAIYAMHKFLLLLETHFTTSSILNEIE